MRHQSAFRTPAFEQISEKPALIYSDVFWALEDQLVSVDLKVAFHLVYLLLPSPSFSPAVSRDPRRSVSFC